jgi:GNAT superfamily N-acetyltransferase
MKVRIEDCRIRPATEDDVPHLVDCLRQAFGPYRDEYTSEAYADTVVSDEGATGRLRSMTVLVAEEPNGTIAGTISWARGTEATGHLRGMAILPRWQGRGLAPLLLQRAIEGLRRVGCKRVSLDTTLPLRRAVRFYEKNGFRKSGKVSDFFGMALNEYVRELD